MVQHTCIQSQRIDQAITESLKDRRQLSEKQTAIETNLSNMTKQLEEIKDIVKELQESQNQQNILLQKQIEQQRIQFEERLKTQRDEIQLELDKKASIEVEKDQKKLWWTIIGAVVAGVFGIVFEKIKNGL